MKRKATPPALAGTPIERSAKAPRIESHIFQQALIDEVGIQTPDVDTLKNCKVANLKSICTRCKLPVSKTGGVKRPVSVKQDYIHAIILQLELQTPPTGPIQDGMVIDECVNEPTVAHTQDPAHICTQGKEPPNDVIKVRLFKDPRDFRTAYKREISHAYHSKRGIKLRDLADELLLNCLCDVIHPKNYKPILVSTDGALDPCLIPMLLGTQGFLRVVERGRADKNLNNPSI